MRVLCSRFFQQVKCADDVGLDKIFGTENQMVHVAFCGKMNDHPRLVLLEQLAQKLAVEDVSLHENVPRIVFQAGKIVEIAGVGELVQIHDGGAFRCDPVKHKIRIDSKK